MNGREWSQINETSRIDMKLHVLMVSKWMERVLFWFCFIRNGQDQMWSIWFEKWRVEGGRKIDHNLLDVIFILNIINIVEIYFIRHNELKTNNAKVYGKRNEYNSILKGLCSWFKCESIDLGIRSVMPLQAHRFLILQFKLNG